MNTDADNGQILKGMIMIDRQWFACSLIADNSDYGSMIG